MLQHITIKMEYELLKPNLFKTISLNLKSFDIYRQIFSFLIVIYSNLER